MTFIFMRQDLAIDLGTSNTVIFHNDKIILDEPSIIAVETKTGKLIAVGAEAQLIEDHTNPDIMTIRPLMNGVIADYDAAETMLSGFIKKALSHDRCRHLLNPTLKIVVGIPGGGSLLRGIARRFSQRTRIEFHVADDPLKAVVHGTCAALKHTDDYKFLMR